MNKFAKFSAEVIGERHPLFRPFLWVSAARSTDDTRPVLNLIRVEREELLCHVVATDGKRMHLSTFDPGMFDTDIDMVPDGLYEVIAKSSKFIVISESEEEFKYPNWKAVFSEIRTPFTDSVNPKSIGRLGINTGVLLATDFVMDAIGFGHGFKKEANVEVSYGANPDGTGPFMIRNEIGKAFVMPLRMWDKSKDDTDQKSDTEATPDMPGFERSPIVDVDEVPLGLPAPVMGLPAPALTDAEKAVSDEARAAGFAARSAGLPLSANPHPFRSPIRAVWKEGWNARDREIKTGKSATVVDAEIVTEEPGGVEIVDDDEEGPPEEAQ